MPIIKIEREIVNVFAIDENRRLTFRANIYIRVYVCVCVHRIVRYYRSTHIYLMQIERANYVFDIEKKKEIIYNSVENVENNRWKNIFTRYVNFSYPCTLLNTDNYSFPFFNYTYIYTFFFIYSIYIFPRWRLRILTYRASSAKYG